MKLMNINLRVEPRLHSFFLVLMAFMALPTTMEAQNQYDYEWMLGYMGEGWVDPNFAMTLLSFHQHPPDTFRTQLVGSAGASNTMSLANSGGELIFYSNGCSLFDPNGETIEGAEELLFGPMFVDECILLPKASQAYRNLAQSTIPLPMDDKDSLFFLLYHRMEWERNAEGFSSPIGLVSFELYKKKIIKNDLGTYEGKERKLILRQNMRNGSFIAVRDTQAHYWWVIIPPDVHLENYEIIRLGPDGVDTIITYEEDYEGIHQDFIDFPYRIQSGQSVISPDGSTYIRWIAYGEMGVLVYDFDRKSGKLSNPRYLQHPERENMMAGSTFGGASISPNGRFLYINTREHLYQYDLWAGDIESSLVHIAEYDGFRDPANNFQVAFNQQKLAPNCKIYISATNSVRYLHVINQPDRKGLDCDFRQHSFKLPGNYQFGLPYHPNYRLGTDYPVCDSTLTTTTWFIPEESDRGLHLYPNPARDYAIVGWSGLEPVEITVYDMSGREAFRSPMQPGLPEYYLDLSGFGAGVYVVRVLDRDGSAWVEKVVVF